MGNKEFSRTLVIGSVYVYLANKLECCAHKTKIDLPSSMSIRKLLIAKLNTFYNDNSYVTAVYSEIY